MWHRPASGRHVVGRQPERDARCGQQSTKTRPIVAPRSRGVLCRELLRCTSARQAVDQAMDELSSGKYDGVNYVIADPEIRLGRPRRRRVERGRVGTGAEHCRQRRRERPARRACPVGLPAVDAADARLARSSSLRWPAKYSPASAVASGPSDDGDPRQGLRAPSVRR